MIETIGWIGAGAFAISSVPQAYKSYREGHSTGVSWGLLVLSQLGEICGMVYGFYHSLYPFVANYVLNFIMLNVIIYFKVRPRGKA